MRPIHWIAIAAAIALIAGAFWWQDRAASVDRHLPALTSAVEDFALTVVSDYDRDTADMRALAKEVERFKQESERLRIAVDMLAHTADKFADHLADKAPR